VVTINSAGTAASGGSFFFTSSVSRLISDAGTRIVFATSATDLVAGFVDGNGGGGSDVFLRDLTAGTTTLISINRTGDASGNGGSFFPSLSADGNRVSFTSAASNLVLTDTNSGALAPATDIFVRDLTAGTTTLVSVNSAGTDSANGVSFDSRISADGSHVAFESGATNLVSGLTDTNGVVDVFVRDLTAGTTFLASINSAGTGTGSAESRFPYLSANGNRVAFRSAANNLVTIDTNIVFDIFVRDLSAGTTIPASINSAGTATGNGTSPSLGGISADGNRVAFGSSASDLVTTPGVSTTNIYVRDIAAGTTTLASISSDGTARGNDTSAFEAFSSDGTLVAYESLATNLVTVTDNNTTGDIFAFALAPAVVPDISINDVTLAEGNAGTSVATFTVTLSAASASTVTVDFVTLGGTATSGTDFVAGSGTVTFTPGDTSEPISVTINGDTLDEPDETFTVNLSNPTNATILDGTGQGTITDDDPPPTISINDVSLAEGDSGTTNATFIVSLSAASGFTVSVDFTTMDGTATLADSDYGLTTGTVTIPAGSTTAPINVPVVGDTTVEPDETFTVVLSNPVNATILDGTGVGTITDDDGAPPFTVTPDVCCFECIAGGHATFNLTVAPSSGPLASPVTFACVSSTVPPLSTCTFSPPSLTVSSGPATTTLVIQTTGPAGSPSARLDKRRGAPVYALWLGLSGMGLLGMVFRGRTRLRLRRTLLSLIGLAILASAGLSCNGFDGPRTSAGTYDVVVTATSGTDSQNITLRVIVEP
jgi:hypothetical protein